MQIYNEIHILKIRAAPKKSFPRSNAVCRHYPNTSWSYHRMDCLKKEGLIQSYAFFIHIIHYFTVIPTPIKIKFKDDEFSKTPLC